MNGSSEAIEDAVDELLLCARGQTPDEAEQNAINRADEEDSVVVNMSVEEGYGGHLACATALPGVDTSKHWGGCRLNAKGVEVANRIAEYSMVHPYRVSANGVVNIPEVSGDLTNPSPRELKRESKSNARTIARAAGWRPVGGGTVRKAYAAPEQHWSGNETGDECVVKVARYTAHDGAGGVDQNVRAVTVWEHANDLSDGVIAPIGMWDARYFGWITQKLGDTDDPVVNEAAIEERMDHLRSEGWSVLDPQPKNWGLIDDELVAIDAGAVYVPDDDNRIGSKRREWREKARSYLRSQPA